MSNESADGRLTPNEPPSEETTIIYALKMRDDVVAHYLWAPL